MYTKVGATMINNKDRSEKSRDQMLSGSAWMTAGSILSRFWVPFISFPGVFGLEITFSEQMLSMDWDITFTVSS